MEQKASRVMVIAGSDSGGGAGIQADLKALTRINCYASTIITAITAQNTKFVTNVTRLNPEIIRAQIDAVISDIGADVIKIGMLSSANVVSVVSDFLEKYKSIKVILDPVILSSSGTPLLDNKGIVLLRNNIMPRTYLITPNVPEAMLLMGIKDEIEFFHCLKNETLPVFGSKFWLIKGGHMNEQTCSDYLLDHNGKIVEVFSSERLKNTDVHGTGCTLASLISGNLAKSENIIDAIRKSKQILFSAIKNAKEIGEGALVLDYDFK